MLLEGRRRLAAGGAAFLAALVCLSAVIGSQRQAWAEHGGRQQTSGLWQLWSGGELGGGLDDKVRRGVVDVGGRRVLPHAPSGRLPGYGGGSEFLKDLEPAGGWARRGAAPARRAAHGADWQRVDVVHPKKQSLAQAGAPAADVPDMSTVIGAYREVAKLVKQAGDHHDLSRKSGDAAAHALERAADSLDSISASLKSAKPSAARLSDIAKSLSGIKGELGSGQVHSGPAQLESVGDAVHLHSARLLGSHFASLNINASSGGNATEGNETGADFHNAYWDDFETNKDGTIKLNDREAKIERHVWRRLFGDRFSHGFCDAFHGKAHCLARKEGRWNYDAQTYKLEDPYLAEENPYVAAEQAAVQDQTGS